MRLKTDLGNHGKWYGRNFCSRCSPCPWKKVMVFEKKPYQGGAVSNCPIAYLSIRNDKDFQNTAFHLLYELF